MENSFLYPSTPRNSNLSAHFHYKTLTRRDVQSHPVYWVTLFHPTIATACFHLDCHGPQSSNPPCAPEIESSVSHCLPISQLSFVSLLGPCPDFGRCLRLHSMFWKPFILITFPVLRSPYESHRNLFFPFTMLSMPTDVGLAEAQRLID